MAKKAETAKKEQTLDMLDLLDGAKAILEINGEVEFSKFVMWDNSNGQQGVMKASYLNIVVRDKNGKTAKFVIGAKGNNLWVGRETKERKASGANSKIEL